MYFDVCFGLLTWWKIQKWPIIRFLTEAIRFWFFICWHLIESMMPCIWTRCSEPLAEKQAHNIKYPAVYLTVDTGYFFIPVCTKFIWWVCCQKAFFPVWSDNRSQRHLKFQSCLTTEFAGVCFWMNDDHFLETLPKNIWIGRGCIIIYMYILGFWPQDSTNLYNSTDVVLGESLVTQTLLLTMH